jgi:hypothetical protein
MFPKKLLKKCMLPRMSLKVDTASPPTGLSESVFLFNKINNYENRALVVYYPIIGCVSCNIRRLIILINNNNNHNYIDDHHSNHDHNHNQNHNHHNNNNDDNNQALVVY